MRAIAVAQAVLGGMLLAGCGLITSGIAELKVIEVVVEPASGQGPFTASVELSPHANPGAYKCWAVPSGAEPVSGVEIMQMRLPPDDRYVKEVVVFTPSTAGLQQVLCTDADADQMAPRAGAGHEVRSNEFTVPYQATGTRTMYDASGHNGCAVDTSVLLTVLPGLTAQLDSQGPDVIDHINCTKGQLNESWLVEGAANGPAGPVTFNTCNGGRFQADGEFTLSDNLPTGQVTCSKDGTSWITIQVR